LSQEYFVVKLGNGLYVREKIDNVCLLWTTLGG